MYAEGGALIEGKAGGAVADDRAEGSRRADFEREWDACRPRVWRLVARLAGDVDLADDLTQEVSVRAFQGYARFRRQSSTFTWFYRIAVNVVLRYRERRRAETLSLDAPEVAALPDAGVECPEDAALRDEQRRRVRAAMERLPEELRTTLILQLYQGLKYREVAAVLGVPIGTVKSRVHSAIQRLREELADSDL